MPKPFLKSEIKPLSEWSQPWQYGSRTTIKNFPLDSNVIREKARSLYHQFAVDVYIEEEEAAEAQVAFKGFYGNKK